MPIVLFISFAIAVGLYIVQPLADPDLWWHVVAGRWILANKSVPTHDIWTLFGSNLDWIAYSWSNEIVFAFFEKHFGLEGLLFLQMLLAIVFAILLCWTLGKVANNYWLGGLLAAVVVCGTHTHFALRPQSIVWLYLVLVLYLSENISKNGFTVRNVIGMMLVLCAWANSHITTIIALAVIAAWTCPDLPLKIKSLSRPLLACLFALIATMFTPYFGYEWIVFFSKSGHPLTFSSIQEFSPANILQTPTAIILLMAALVTAFWFLNSKAVTVMQLLGAAFLTLGSLAVIKFLPFALIYLGFILARQWAELGARPSEKIGLVQALQNLEALLKKVPKEGLSFVLICSAIVNAHNTWDVMIDKSYTPVEALDLIKTNNLPLPMMNSFGDGGYVSYRFADQDGNPGLKVSIDGRTNLIPHDIWEKYQDTWHGDWGWKEYMEKVQPKVILWRSDSALIRILEAEGKWCTVFNKQPKSVSSVVMLERETVEMLNAQGNPIRCL